MRENPTNRERPLVLVVDDDVATRFIAREGLEGAGFDVEEAGDGVSALALFESRDPDVVLLDIMMPNLDGFETCLAIRQRPRGTHAIVVIMTGMDDTDSINRAFEVGATSFVTKPVKPLILSYRIRYMLRAKRTADQLRESEARLSHAQRIARLGHWELDPGERVVHCSQSTCRIFGLSPQNTKVSHDEFLLLVHPADREILEDTIDRSLREHKGYKIEHRIVRPDGSQRIVYQEAEIFIDENGDISRFIGIVQDITERRSAQDKIRYLAYFDTVTGLPNRTFLKEFLEHAVANAKRHRRLVGILFLDLDHFKRINDTLGHEAGDILLRDVARRLGTSLRRSDRLHRDGRDDPIFAPPGAGENAVTRLGGDEFVILLTEVQRAEDCASVAARMAAALSEPFVVLGNEITITASVGISIYPMDGDSIEVLLKNADSSMYHAKELGRNRYQFFTTSLNDRAVRRFSLETNLRKALEREELLLHYQPRIDVQRHRIVGMEALIRWKHPEAGKVSPEEFIPLAEEFGLIVPIGDWVLRTACAQASAWQAAGLPALRLSVNLSAIQFKQKHMAKWVEKILQQTGLDARFLEMELTEGVLVEDVETAIATLNDLKALGLSISIDDFGTGYSSLSYLKRFPLTALKIDRSFVRDINVDANDSAIVSATIALAHNLGLEVVAEGVETQEQLDFLCALRCDEVQGYFFSRPLPVDEFADWVRVWQRAKESEECHPNA